MGNQQDSVSDEETNNFDSKSTSGNGSVTVQDSSTEAS